VKTPLDLEDSDGLGSILSMGEEVASQWASVLPTVGDEIASLRRRFDQTGAIGALILDCSVLAQIERSGGADARRRAFDALGVLVQELARELLDIEDLAVVGETGRNEIIILVFREAGDSGFFRRELPGFDKALREALAGRGSKVFYPHLREVPRMSTGVAIALRNPQFSVDTQVMRLLDEARRDADLGSRLRQRRDRHGFLELLLDRRISSVYEPIVDVASRTVFGYEALARGPEGTAFHSPLALFGAAEQHDLVFELDCLCRGSGLKGAVDFPAGTKLFLNILPTTIHDPNFRADRLIQTLEECKLCPSDVVFEISEQESISNFGAFREMRDYYRHLGFQFALDDTGSGYAGLEALLEITPEYIKMDRAFVSGIDQDPARQELLRALRSVADQTGAKIIGEGLDTLEELEMLGELGITFGQGWLFGHPHPLRAK
jgi:EAL domain-containing protein (putative c-di-GMP-specific phosphodiesterase class I)